MNRLIVKSLLTTYILLLFATGLQAQFIGPTPLVVPGDNYAFAFSSSGTTADVSLIGLYFDKTGATPGFEFRGVGASTLAKVHTLPAGNREAGDISFGPTGSLIVGSNRYAFRHSIVEAYGLFFNASDIDYEFRTSDATPVFAIGANSGHIRTNGRLGLGTLDPKHKLQIELESDPIAVYINNKYKGSNTSFGVCIESRDTTVTNTRFGFKNYMTGGTGSRIGFSSTIFADSTNSSNVFGVYSFVDETATQGDGYAIFASTDVTSDHIWSGYFTGKNYMNELRIGSVQGSEGFKLSVDGKAVVEELLVLDADEWPDYVFEEDYSLMSIPELKQQIQTLKHLPGIPSADDVARNGIAIGDMQKKMMEKIEELTLYVIQLSGEVDRLKKTNRHLKKSKRKSTEINQ